MRPLAPILLAAVLGATACSAAPTGTGASDPQAATAADETLVIAIDGEPNTLNPVFGDVFGSANGDHWPIFSSLLSYDADLEFAPDLATEVPEVADDGTLTVALRDDVAWHDGEPFTADDVVFTYDAILTTDTDTHGTPLRDLVANSVQAVAALDEHTVEFTLARVDPAILHKLTFGIVPEHVLADEDLATARFNVEPVGTGPFVFDEFREGERLVLTANPDYHGGEVGLPRVVFAFVGDENVRIARLEAGEIDVDAVGLTPRIAERFAADDRYRIVSIPGEQYSLSLPRSNPILADQRVRQAIGLGIDREQFTAGLFGDAGRPGNGPFQPQHWAYDPVVERAADPAAAARLLDEAGWTPGPDGVRERDGERLSLEFVHGTDPMDANAAIAIADGLAGLGVEVELEGVGNLTERWERGAAGAVTTGRPGNAYDPELSVYRDFHSANAESTRNNRTGIDEPEIDAALAEAGSSYDRDERRAGYSRLAQEVVDEASVQYLAQRDYQLIVPANVEGIEPAALDSHLHGWSRALLWNLDQWRLG